MNNLICIYTVISLVEQQKNRKIGRIVLHLNDEQFFDDQIN